MKKILIIGGRCVGKQAIAKAVDIAKERGVEIINADQLDGSNESIKKKIIESQEPKNIKIELLKHEEYFIPKKVHPKHKNKNLKYHT